MTNLKRKYDVVVWGVTGFTGTLVAEYLAKNYPALTWAVAGRSKSRIEDVLRKLSVKKDIIVADIKNTDSMDAMCSQTKVIISTAGPFALLGTPVVAACVRNATNYCDITGEGQWYREIVGKKCFSIVD